MAYTDREVAGWTAVASQLYEQTVTDAQSRQADHAAAMIVSGSGFLEAPSGVLEMFNELIAVGYVQALRDARDGKADPW